MNYSIISFVFISALFQATHCLAQEDAMATDWMPLVVGHKDSKIGAEMRSVKTDQDTGGQTLIIAIPKIAMGGPGEMEEVIVVGQAPQERGPMFDFKYETEWLDDYGQDHYGLLIRLGNSDNWPIRLFVQADDGPRSKPDLANQ